MRPELILITENISFKNLIDGNVSSVEVYKDQMDKWLFEPIKYLADMHLNNEAIRFSHGYSVFALELLFFEPHGQYLDGRTNQGSKTTFNIGFNRYLEFLLQNNYIDTATKNRIDSMDFYNITRCGIYHSLTIKSKVLIDSRKGITEKVFNNSFDEGLFVYPWNFVLALEKYFSLYIEELIQPAPNDLKDRFERTFNTLFSIANFTNSAST